MTDEPKPDAGGVVIAEQAAAQPSAVPADEMARLSDEIVTAIKTVYDPEIPVNIFELGLIYVVDIQDDGQVKVEMTLTAPGCPSAQELPVQVREQVMTVPGVTECDVEVVWEPAWDPSRMSEEARLQLNMF